MFLQCSEDSGESGPVSQAPSSNRAQRWQKMLEWPQERRLCHLHKRRWRSRQTGSARPCGCGRWCRSGRPRRTPPPLPCHPPARRCTCAQAKSWGEIRGGKKVTERGEETRRASTYSDIKLLQGKELMIHLHGPQQLLRTVHQLQRPCHTSQTDGSESGFAAAAQGCWMKNRSLFLIQEFLCGSVRLVQGSSDDHHHQLQNMGAVRWRATIKVSLLVHTRRCCVSEAWICSVLVNYLSFFTLVTVSVTADWIIQQKVNEEKHGGWGWFTSWHTWCGSLCFLYVAYFNAKDHVGALVSRLICWAFK